MILSLQLHDKNLSLVIDTVQNLPPNIFNNRFMFGSFQQWRLIPKLATTYALVYFARTFFMNFVELQVGMMMGETGEAQVSYLTIILNPLPPLDKVQI